ncbi:MAG: helix-turn-helix transcriptional regulator [Fibrobacterota bacterium]
MDSTKITRIFEIVRILLACRHPVDVYGIMDRLDERGVPVPSKRTIYRDLEIIESVGYRITWRKKQGSFYIRNREDFAGGFFTSDMIWSLTMGRALFRYFDGTIFKDTIDEAIDLITGQSSSAQSVDPAEEGVAVKLGPLHSYRHKSDCIDEIIPSIHAQYRLHVSYGTSENDAKSYCLDPYRILLYRDSLYLQARKEGDDYLKLFHVSRILSARQLEDTFERDTALVENYDERSRHSFGVMTRGELRNVSITFDASVYSHLAERVWHPSQKIEPTGAEEVVLHLEVLVNAELVTWILGWGNKVHAVEPASLRERVKQQALQASSL